MVVATYFTSRLAGRENRVRRFFLQHRLLQPSLFILPSSGSCTRYCCAICGRRKDGSLSPPDFYIPSSRCSRSSSGGWWYRKNGMFNGSLFRPGWFIPVCYLIFILIRGRLSGFYPYPFVDASVLGYEAVTFNSLGLVLVFIVLASLFIAAARLSGNRKSI